VAFFENKRQKVAPREQRMMKKEKDAILDVAGVGIGPFNLSAAALLQPLKELRAVFYERAPEFQWHSGLLFPEATIQVSFLKDLVTLVDPTNPYSFLSFLSSTKRLYSFITASFPRLSRVEFNQYFQWVCASLPNLRFGRAVEAVFYDGQSMVLDLGDELVRASNLILGSGLSPVVPECARPHLGPSVFHASLFLKKNIKAADRQIAIIGGGQTGAEVFYHLLCDSGDLPRQLYWISRRPNFLPLDESPFTNELFTPNYSKFFFNLPEEEKLTVLAQQKLASDGIAAGLLDKIYRRLYEIEFLSNKNPEINLCPSRELIDLSPVADGRWALVLGENCLGRFETIYVDVVVLCTGAKFKVPKYLDPLLDRIPLDQGRFLFRNDFSIEWDGPKSNRIYAQNAALHARGVSDPNLSLMAWRSAKIVNSLAGRTVYDIDNNSSFFDWMMTQTATKSGATI
jgi:lysine N6-hydroxylase